jgi:IS5 family transposase
VIDYSWIRRRIVCLGGDLVSYDLRSVKDPVVIVLDSTGVKVFRSGSWLERRYSRRRGYLKIHFAIDARTGEIVYFERTTDRVHDSEVAKRMVDRSMEAGNVITVIGDGAYDSIGFIRHLERKGIEPIIRPRRNARTDRGPPSRRSAARMIRYYGYRAWRKMVGYGRRWVAETAISRFKALFGEHLLSR